MSSVQFYDVQISSHHAIHVWCSSGAEGRSCHCCDRLLQRACLASWLPPSFARILIKPSIQCYYTFFLTRCTRFAAPNFHFAEFHCFHSPISPASSRTRYFSVSRRSQPSGACHFGSTSSVQPAPNMPNSSIQSYFSSSSPSKGAPGDGFTLEELQVAPPTSAWVPIIDYEESDIASLEPGPRHLTLMGRVVNFYDTPKPSKRPKAAQDFVKIMIADDTGTMSVRLWYAKSVYPLELGQLVSLWTVHISQGYGQVGLAPSTAPLFTSIFPEHERNCHFMIHERSDDGSIFKRPFGARDSQVLPGLMTLKNFVDGGFDVDDCKVMVCVKSIGPRKKCK